MTLDKRCCVQITSHKEKRSIVFLCVYICNCDGILRWRWYLISVRIVIRASLIGHRVKLGPYLGGATRMACLRATGVAAMAVSDPFVWLQLTDLSLILFTWFFKCFNFVIHYVLNYSFSKEYFYLNIIQTCQTNKNKSNCSSLQLFFFFFFLLWHAHI